MSDDVGGPLVVGGVEIPPDEIRRHLIQGPGRDELEFLMTEHLIEQGIAEQLADGAREPAATPADFAVSDEELARYLTQLRRRYERTHPALSFDTRVLRTHRSPERFARLVRQALVFDKVFLPQDQSRWPALSVEPSRGTSGDLLLDDFRESLQDRRGDHARALGRWIGRRRLHRGPRLAR